MMKPRINFVTLGVADMARARAFYERLGLAASKASNPEVTFFDVNGTVLALFGHGSLAEDAGMAPAPTPAFRGMALAWNAASEAEADGILAHAEKAGGRIVKKARKVFWGGYSGYFADPDGHLWEVAYNPFFPLDENGRIKLP
jgi:catechol 2,3-dioxygenase-like lactoylglutathione lyase family enzyme